MSSSIPPFENSLENWAQHFKLSPQAVEVLRDYIGVVAFDDLGIIYNDDQILEDLQNLMKRLDYVKFMNARSSTLEMLGSQLQQPSEFAQKPSATSKDNSKVGLEVVAIPEVVLNESMDDFSTETEGHVKAICPIIPTADSQLFQDDDFEDAASGPVVALPVANVLNFEEEIREVESRNNHLNSLIHIIDDEITRRKVSRLSGSPERTARLVESIPLPPPPPQPDLTDLRKFLLHPVGPELGIVLCSFVRNRISDHRPSPSYTVFIENGHHFLMSATRKNGIFRVSMAPEDAFTRPDRCLAEIKSNFMGTDYQFNIYRPEENASIQTAKHEIGAVCYERKAAFNQSPRCMDVVLPNLDEEGKMGLWNEQEKGENLLGKIKRKNHNGLMFLKNRPPQWNAQLNCYVLNFKGRVSMASVKNFQLVRPGHENDVILQFGKVGSDFFVMDMKYPITPLQAFCLSLSSFDN